MPAGWGVLYCITDTHECAADFTAQFRPEQWMTRGAGAPQQHQGDPSANSNASGGETVTRAKREHYDFIPFGAGSRLCPGQEFAKQMLRLLLVELCMRTEWRCNNPGAWIKSSPVPFAEDNLPVEISLRE